MKPSDFQRTIQCQFDSKLKKIVRSGVKDYYKSLNRRKKKEVFFSDLPDIVVENIAVYDDYETDYTFFTVCGNDIRVYNDELAEALKQLSEKKRDIVLMFYFLEMSDSELGERLNITRRSSHRNRTSSLEKIRKMLKQEEESANENNV